MAYKLSDAALEVNLGVYFAPVLSDSTSENRDGS